MRDWLVDIVPSGYVDAVIWTGLALLLFVASIVAIRFLRNGRAGTFVAGGRNRRTRLSVMDAAAIDGRRRLVLVRRDDVEHLILIGGPTDVVVEQDIRFAVRSSRAAPMAETEADAFAMPDPVPTPPKVPPLQPAQAAPRTLPQQPPRAAAPQAGASIPPAPTVAPPQAAPRTPVEPRPAPRPVEARSAPVAARPAPAPVAPPARKQPDRTNSLDEDLIQELEVSLDEAAAPRKASSLEDEMNKLLGELSSGRR